jgi:hypothetical protein
VAEDFTDLIQPVSERQNAMEVQLSELAQAVKALEARLAALGHPAATAAVTEAVHREQEKVTPETLVVIAAAVTAFLGKKVRIRSAKLLQQRAFAASAWAQQGRAAVHASHNPRHKG